MAVSNKKSTIQILHVDDDPTIQEITKLVLLDLDSNLEIDNACCVDDGIKKLSSKKYDVVVSDYEMPQKDGLQFLKELREKRNGIPFILFTGKGREEVAIKALNLGADGYFNKQGSPETVYGELAYGIRRSFEHRKAHMLLRKSQEELKAIVNNAPLGIATSDSNMQFKSANEAFCRIVGYSEDELQKRTFRDITYPDDVETSNKDMRELICGNIHYFSKEKRYVRKDGRIIDGKVTVSTIRNSDGKPSLFVAELEDITQRKQAESELRETFNVLERVGEGIDAGLAVIGKDYRVVWANKRLMDLGVAPSKKCYETFNNLGAVCPDCGVEKIFKQNLPLDVHEYKTVNSKGETTWIELRATPLKDEEGNLTAALELAVPITDRKKAEEALRISESHYRLLAENAQDVIWIGNLDGHFTYVSPSVLQLRGYTPEEVLKQSLLEALTPDSARIVSEAMRESLETGVVPSNHFELEQPCKNGSTVWTEVSFSVVRDKTGNPQSVLGVSRDITTRKCMETKLQQSEEQFRQLFSSMPSAVAVYEAVDGGADFLFVDFNEKAENIEKISKSNVVGKRVTEVFPGVKSSGIFSVFQRVWQSAKPEYYPEALYKDNKDQGSWRENWVYKLPNGNIVAIYNDITEREKAEEALREADYRLQKMSTQTPGMLYQFKKRPDGTYCVPFTSEAIQNIFGCSPQDVREDFSPIAKVIVPEDLDRVISSIEYSAENMTPWTCKYRVKLPSQEIQWVWGQSIPEKLADGSIIWYGYNVDISEGKKIEDALTQSKQKFKALFASNPEATVFYDPDFHVLEANPEFCNLFGFSLDEIKGKDIVDLIVPDGAKDETENIRQRIKSGLVEIVTTRKRKDGSEIPLLLTGSPVFLDEKIIGSIFVFKDIADIITVQEDLSNALSKAQQLNEKLMVVGSLTRHDVRNKLSAITGYSYILKKKHADVADVVESLEKMEAAVKDSMKIFDFAKAYELIGVEELADIDVAKTISEAVGMFSGLPFKIVNNCQGLTVRADSLLRQLIYNFIDNTRKYGQKTTLARVYYQKTNSGELKLIYEDDGVGVPTENKEKLFKQGFSTGGSTGFGLFLSKKMIDVYGWNIFEEGKPGKGAKFVISIPMNLVKY